MKHIKTSLIILLIFITINSYCQVPNTNMLETMINKSLYAVLLSTKAYYESHNNFRKLSDDAIWVNTFPPYFQFSDKIIKTGIKFKNMDRLDSVDIQNRVNGFILSVKLNVDTIFINITNASISRDASGLNLGINGDGYAFFYKYSCENNKWELIKTKPKDLIIFVE